MLTTHGMAAGKVKMMHLIAKRPTANFVVMTPDLVDALLAINTKNRNERASVVATYKRAVEGNMWVPTNQGIGVSASGFLVDGQHRLKALREAGYPPVIMLVATGLPDEAIAAVDGGSNRTARDYLSLMFDAKVSNLVAAVVRTTLLARKPSFDPIKFLPQEYADQLEVLGDSIRDLLTIESVQRLPAAVVAALVDAHHKGWGREVKEFTAALITGEMLPRDNPALVLRNWLANTKGSGGTSVTTERYRKTTRALQAWVDETPLSKLYSTKARLQQNGCARRT